MNANAIVLRDLDICGVAARANDGNILNTNDKIISNAIAMLLGTIDEITDIVGLFQIVWIIFQQLFIGKRYQWIHKNIYIWSRLY